MVLLEVKELNYYYQDGEHRRFILKETNVSFEKGKFYTIVGPSGAGKTTFLSLISALDRPQEGAVLIRGKSLQVMGEEVYRRNESSIIFQHYNLVPYLTAVENVLLTMAITDNPTPKDAKTVAYNLLDYIGIELHKADRLVTKLSGGEQQRVAIARALATNGELILADEPTGNLDEAMEQEIVQIFKQLARDHGKCVIVVTHSMDIAKQSDETWVLSKGVLRRHE